MCAKDTQKVLPNDGCYHYSAGKSTRAMVVVEKAIFPPFQKALQFSIRLITLHAMMRFMQN